jgi:hypothetical protein
VSPSARPLAKGLEQHPLGKGPLFLRRHSKAGHGGKPVLLIHGASAAGDTFLVPAGESVFDFLLRAGFDVWLLDWRASFRVAQAHPQQANRNIDEAIADLPDALAFIHRQRQGEGTDQSISVLAHCMGGACFAMAIGAGLITPEHDVDNVLLSTIGLFYSVTWDGWMKVMDRVLERVRDESPQCLQISPADKVWPPAMQEAYDLWPETWGPPWGKKGDAKGDFFHRLAFLYGQPFLVSKLHPAMTQDVVRGQFGAIPIEFYRHAAQNALRGFAIGCDAEGRLHPETPNAEVPFVLASKYLNVDRFVPFRITLLTGALNPLWHRDSIDLMAEWLSRNRAIVFSKIVLDDYGHQDLWWGRKSWNEVFPRVADALTAKRAKARALTAVAPVVELSEPID